MKWCFSELVAFGYLLILNIFQWAKGLPTPSRVHNFPSRGVAKSLEQTWIFPKTRESSSLQWKHLSTAKWETHFVTTFFGIWLKSFLQNRGKLNQELSQTYTIIHYFPHLVHEFSSLNSNQTFNITRILSFPINNSILFRLIFQQYDRMYFRVFFPFCLE